MANTYACCKHCADDPEYHAKNPPDSHEAECTLCQSSKQDISPLIDLANWLVSLDDPFSLPERRSVSLSMIIERARQALINTNLGD